jgi:predicted N-formylglutamate amidohydrolase
MLTGESRVASERRCVDHGTHLEHSCVAAMPVLLVCDHASNQVPVELHNLGVSDADRARHIGWDIGAAAVAEGLGVKLQVPVIMAAHSRLVVDCNRRLDDPSAFPLSSGGTAIPGNRGLADADRQARAEHFYWPYHHAIGARLQALEGQAAAPALLAIHSFTPELEQERRPWHMGVLWDKDSRIAQPLLAALQAQTDWLVGDNEPYSGRDPADFTLDYHAEAEGRPHVGIEIRQDLIASTAGVAKMVDLLYVALTPVLNDPRLYTLRSGTA